MLAFDQDARHGARFVGEEANEPAVETQIDALHLFGLVAEEGRKIRSDRLAALRAVHAGRRSAAARGDVFQFRAALLEPRNRFGGILREDFDELRIARVFAALHRVGRHHFGCILNALGLLIDGARRVHTARRELGVAARDRHLFENDDVANALFVRLHGRNETRSARAHDYEIGLFRADGRDVLVGREVLPLPFNVFGAAERDLHRREVVAAQAVRLRFHMARVAGRALNRADVARVRIGLLLRVGELFKTAVTAHTLLVDLGFRVTHLHAVDVATGAVETLLHVRARELRVVVLVRRLSTQRSEKRRKNRGRCVLTKRHHGSPFGVVRSGFRNRSSLLRPRNRGDIRCFFFSQKTIGRASFRRKSLQISRKCENFSFFNRTFAIRERSYTSL